MIEKKHLYSWGKYILLGYIFISFGYILNYYYSDAKTYAQPMCLSIGNPPSASCRFVTIGGPSRETSPVGHVHSCNIGEYISQVEWTNTGQYGGGPTGDTDVFNVWCCPFVN